MSETAKSIERLSALRHAARRPLRKLMAAAGVFAASAALAPAAMADYDPNGLGTIGATGHHDVGVVLVNFPGNAPLDPEQINQAMFTAPDSVSNYFSTTSFGQLQLSGKILGSVGLPNGLAPSCAGGSFLKIGTEANRALRHEGLSVDGYDNYVYFLSQQQQCTNPNNGQILNGQTTGNVSFINRSSNDQAEGVDVHELGHQFGLSHANAAHCYSPDGKRVPTPFGLQGRCIPVIYQDPFDPMGEARFSVGQPIDFDALDKARLGWLKPENIKTVDRSQTVTIAPDETASVLPQLVQIPLKGRGKHQFLYLDYRQPIGEDAKITDTDRSASMFSGITMREAGPIGHGSFITLNDYTNLIDTNPKTMTAFDSPLPADKAYRDAKTGITIKPIRLSAGSAEVSISLPRST